MGATAITKAAVVIEEEIAGLRKEVNECRNNTGMFGDDVDPAEKKAALGAIKDRLGMCSCRLEEIAEMLASLQKKGQEVDALCRDVAVLLEKSLKPISPGEDQDFSVSSISPLA